MSPILTSEQVNTLAAMAMRDSTLKQELLDAPHAAVHTHLGVEVPPTKTLRVIQAETQTLTLVISPRPADWPSDLSVEDATARLLSELPALDDKVRKATEFQMQLTARAWQDEPFKHRLLHDAKAAVVQELAVTLPDELKRRAPTASRSLPPRVSSTGRVRCHVIDQRHPLHRTHLRPVVIGGIVLTGQVVPKGDGVRRPTKATLEFGQRIVIGEMAQQRLRFRGLQSLNGHGKGGIYPQQAFPRNRVNAHQWRLDQWPNAKYLSTNNFTF